MDVNYIPNLTELAAENIQFSGTEQLGGAYQCQGTNWTIAGVLASSTGVNYKLPIMHNSEDEYESLWPGLTGIGDILEDAGYSNYYMCGSDSTFAGKKTFLETHGDYTIYDYSVAMEEGLIPEGYYENWGFEDERLYSWAKEKISEISGGNEPFNFTLLTSDTHFHYEYVCDLCEERYPDDCGNVYACADRQIVDFISWAKEQAWYDDTTIVITGDHISMNTTFFEQVPDSERMIYNCIINSSVSGDAQTTKNRVFNSMDMFPTILASMGVTIDGERLGLGTNLFSGDQTLAERMGAEALDEELKKTSLYYLSEFCN